MKAEERVIHRSTQQLLAFLYRSWCMTRRNSWWFSVGMVYQLVAAATTVLIGKAQGNDALVVTLLIGVLVWAQLSAMFDDIAHNVTFERWEDTIEVLFAAPVLRSVHLAGVCLYAVFRAALQTVFVMVGLALLTGINLWDANLWGMLVVISLSTIAFCGLGMMVATIPLIWSESGPQATCIVQGVVMLVSGVGYPIAVLPGWLQVASWFSPATHALSACRKLAGIQWTVGESPRFVPTASLADVWYEISVLAVMALIFPLLGREVFRQAEKLMRRKGMKRNG